MTLINDDDRLLVERNGSLYYIPVSDMSTLQDTDLLMIQRGGTMYKMEAQYLGLAPAYFLVEFLVIAGGGDWGDYVPASNGTPGQGYGGGGGAGGYISSVTGELTGGGSNAINPNVLTTDGTYSVTVGAASSNTIFSGTDLVGLPFNYTALAGGAGGQTGGSAGGGFGAAVLGTPGQGSASAAGNLPESYCSQTRFACAGECKPAYTGGGGGAGGPGNGVNGGIGVQSSITGTPTYYAGGGASQTVCYSERTNGTPGAGADAYGGGGSYAEPGQPGVVILRYPGNLILGNPGGGLVFSTSTVGNDKVTTITAGTGDINFTEA